MARFPHRERARLDSRLLARTATWALALIAGRRSVMVKTLRRRCAREAEVIS